jgi:diacylglycerol kinase family enzyme
MTFGSTTAAARSVLLVRNPTAGRRRRGLLDAVVRLVRAAGWTVDVVDTAARGDAQRIAAACDKARYGVIAVAGGDGTINEVVNGLSLRKDDGPPLAIVPLGTANVLAHELGMGFSAAAVARTLMSGRMLSMRPGEVSSQGPARSFSLMAGTGFDARVVAGVTSPLKRRWGKGAYVWRSLVEAWHYRPVRYAVEIDGVAYQAASVIVSRGRLYAGPYVVAPAADLASPMLHVCLLERWGRWQPLRFGAALVLGRLSRTGGIRVIAGREVRLSVHSEAGEKRGHPVQIDGDDALTLPISVAVGSGTVRLLLPES